MSHERAAKHYAAMAAEAALVAAGLDTLYEIYSTDADENHGVLVHQGFSRDMAETKMYLMFRASGYATSYLMFNHKTQAHEIMCFTARDLLLRGQCSS